MKKPIIYGACLALAISSAALIIKTRSQLAVGSKPPNQLALEIGAELEEGGYIADVSIDASTLNIRVIRRRTHNGARPDMPVNALLQQDQLDWILDFVLPAQHARELCSAGVSTIRASEGDTATERPMRCR